MSGCRFIETAAPELDLTVFSGRKRGLRSRSSAAGAVFMNGDLNGAAACQTFECHSSLRPGPLWRQRYGEVTWCYVAVGWALRWRMNWLMMMRAVSTAPLASVNRPGLMRQKAAAIIIKRSMALADVKR